MSLFEDAEKDRPNLFRAPPIRKLFSSQTIEESDQDSRHELETFKVFVRIKPVSDDYSLRNTIKIVDSHKLICKPPSTSKVHKSECVEYTFSRIFSAKSTQQDIFNDCVVPCIKDLVDLQNSLIFTYGTTNAGKTYTVQGHPTDPGIIPRTLYSLFTNISPDTGAVYTPHMAKNYLRLSSEQSQEELNFTEDMIRTYVSNLKYYKNMSYSEVLNYEYKELINILDEKFVELHTNFPMCTIWISFIELYNEIIFDLLEFSGPRKPLKLSVDKHNNFYVKGLKHIVVRSFEEAYTIYRIGKKNLNVACTKMNENSSRSHCIFTIKLINHKHKVVSKLSICDLAGTERQTKAQNFGMRLKESGTINSSLFQLNRCLRALRENQTKNTSQLVPFRQSKLTKLIHTVFDDKSDEKIVMIVNINPLGELYDETQQVLKMCAIASKIKSKPIMSKILRQSTRFTSYVYGKDSSSLLDEDHQYENDYFECDEDCEIQCEENQQLKEQLALKEQELNTMKQRFEGCCELYKKSQNMLSDYMATVENDQKELEESFKRKIEFYEQKIEALKNNPENLCSDNDLRNEILEKDLMIEDLKLQLNNKSDGRQCLNTVKLQEEIYEKIKKIDELESLLAEGKTAYKTVVDELSSMSEKLNTVESQLQEKTELAEALEINLSQKQIVIEDLEARIENLEETLCDNTIEHEMILSDLEKQRNEMKNKLEVAQEQFATMQEEKIILQQNKELLELQLKTFEETINKLTEDVDSINTMAIEQKQFISVLKRERGEAKAKLDKLTHLDEEIDSLRENNSGLIKSLKQAVEKQLETESQLSSLRKEFETVRQENELLNKEIKIHRELIIDLDEAKISRLEDTKRYNTRNNRTPLKQLGKENKPTINRTPTNNSSSKLRKARQKDKLFKTDILNDSVEPEFFRVFEPENAGKESTTGRKKKLFSTPVSENLISFDSTEKDRGRFLDVNFDNKPKSEVATPAQTVKALRKKKLN